MPRTETVEAFIATVEANRHDEAIERFYAADASMLENLDAPRLGRDGLIARERAVMARAKTIRSRCVRPAFMDGDHVVIRWSFDFEWTDGSTMTMDEIAYQRWDGEKIAEERFYYDPAQTKASGPADGT